MADNSALVRLLRQLTVETDRFAEIFGDRQGMHRTDLNALAVIMDARWSGEPMSPGKLAEAMHLSASATTSVLDRLEASGHVERTRSPRDRRKVELHVHPKALDLGRAFFEPLNEAFTAAWAGFDDREKEVVARFLAASIDATVAVRGGLDP
ncbi:MarR family transcriptional regulator [Saccharothrix longispora]|uniref:MarR family winged helix-turn-helix transcriptional regulator n=1 Tax=Saccharothrix longispora TaxID=33920 RepID=UPI0028FD08F4|nr:MarR family transcriptional regulator [Saccharothrix longispora]MBY8849285.1 MarR family transcriptional regulator [Saccharothrix sp. MB29]MDU0294102.1 MarR family transcriptional regulator [Saccharothrix longispora]